LAFPPVQRLRADASKFQKSAFTAMAGNDLVLLTFASEPFGRFRFAFTRHNFATARGHRHREKGLPAASTSQGIKEAARPAKVLGKR